jgi:hypothetical protein
MATDARPAKQRDTNFYTAVAATVALIVFAGFARTYYLADWLTPPSRTPTMTPLLHVHAIVFTVWIVLGVVQPALIAAGQRPLHRTIGWFAAATAFAVWLLGNLVSIEAIEHGFRGVGDPFAFYAITFFSMQAFGLIVIFAILNRRRTESHKRLMLLSSAAILEAAFGRLPLEIMADAAPLSFYIGSDLIILAGIVHDKRTFGRVHPVWLWGGGALALSQILRIAVMQTGPWLAFSHWVASLW